MIGAEIWCVVSTPPAHQATLTDFVLEEGFSNFLANILAIEISTEFVVWLYDEGFCEYNAGLDLDLQEPIADFLDQVIGTLSEGVADEVIDFLKNDLPELSNIVAVQAADFFDTVLPQLATVLQQPATDFFDKVLPNLIENVQELSVSRLIKVLHSIKIRTCKPSLGS